MQGNIEVYDLPVKRAAKRAALEFLPQSQPKTATLRLELTL